MHKNLAALLGALFLTTVCQAGGLENGIYIWDAKEGGTVVKRNDGGGEVALGKRIGPLSGQAVIYSTSNDNSQFRLDLKKVGPLPGYAETGGLGLVLDGIVVAVWGHSDRQAGDTFDFDTTVYGGKEVQKFAAQFKTDVQKREDPGHRLTIHWVPDKQFYRIGEPIQLTMELHNVGSVPVEFIAGGKQRGARDNQFQFLANHGSGDGKPVPDTGDSSNYGGKGSFVTLKPGEVFKKEVVLNKWFDFKEADYYQVVGLYEIQLLEKLGLERAPRELWDERAVGVCIIHVLGKE